MLQPLIENEEEKEEEELNSSNQSRTTKSHVTFSRRILLLCHSGEPAAWFTDIRLTI